MEAKLQNILIGIIIVSAIISIIYIFAKGKEHFSGGNVQWVLWTPKNNTQYLVSQLLTIDDKGMGEGTIWGKKTKFNIVNNMIYFPQNYVQGSGSWEGSTFKFSIGSDEYNLVPWKTWLNNHGISWL